MAGTFGILNTAYSGLAAARAALEVTGQNVSNASTAGYTRQRVDQSELANAPAVYFTGDRLGQGVKVSGITRIADEMLNARVRTTAGTSSYWSTTASAMSSVEGSLNEPGTSGISSALSDFWAGWQGMANDAGSTQTSTAQANVLIAQGQLVANRISAGYTAAANAWSGSRAALSTTVDTINAAAKQVATLNDQIMRTQATGAGPNELMDQRDTALGRLAKLTGATSRTNADGTVDVSIGGNAVVSGVTARALRVAGTNDMASADSDPVHLEWTDTGRTAAVDGGEVAARLSTLAGSAAGRSGGVYAEAAKVYDDLATSIAVKVNALHEQGSTTSGATGLDFFKVGSSGPAALSLSVVPTDATGIAAGDPAKGRADGSVADAIAQLGSASGSPDASWASFVSRIGVQSQSATTQSSLADSAAKAASTAQTSESGVDLDEETANLVTFQHAYQAAARVLTTVDTMLDTIINKLGIGG